MKKYRSKISLLNYTLSMFHVYRMIEEDNRRRTGKGSKIPLNLAALFVLIREFFKGRLYD